MGCICCQTHLRLEVPEQGQLVADHEVHHDQQEGAAHRVSVVEDVCKHEHVVAILQQGLVQLRELAADNL